MSTERNIYEQLRKLQKRAGSGADSHLGGIHPIVALNRSGGRSLTVGNPDENGSLTIATDDLVVCWVAGERRSVDIIPGAYKWGLQWLEDSIDPSSLFDLDMDTSVDVKVVFRSLNPAARKWLAGYAGEEYMDSFSTDVYGGGKLFREGKRQGMILRDHDGSPVTVTFDRAVSQAVRGYLSDLRHDLRMEIDNRAAEDQEVTL